MSRRIIFYSWQSWTDKAANRNFIQECLDRAIRAIAKDESIHLDPVMDRDTRGCPGSPDIAETIFEKIADTDVFVADVSLVHRDPPTPNPNVLVELGYALAKLGKSKVLCIHNLSTGAIELLPFDIRPKRVISYDLGPKDDTDGWRGERTAARKRLTDTLEAALRDILATIDPETAEFVFGFVNALHNVLIFGDQAPDRVLNPGPVELQTIYDATAGDLRKMSAGSPSHSLGLATAMDELADALDSVVRSIRGLNTDLSGDNLDIVRAAMGLASRIKTQLIEKVGRLIVPRNDLADIREKVIQAHREVDSAFRRLDAIMSKPGGLQGIYLPLSAVGWELLRYAHLDLNGIQAGFSDRLRPIARRLHLLGIGRDFVGGGQRAAAYTESELREVSDELRVLVESLPAK